LDHNSFQDSGSFSTVEVPLLSASTSRCASPSPSLPPLLYHSPPSNPPQNDNEALEVHLDPSIDSKKPRIVLRDPVFLELIEKSGASSVSSETCLPREQPDPGQVNVLLYSIQSSTVSVYCKIDPSCETFCLSTDVATVTSRLDTTISL
jgi:hypothetical protein